MRKPTGFERMTGENVVSAPVFTENLLTFPVANGFREALGTFFPIFYVSEETLAMQLVAALIVGVVAAVFPAWRAARLRVVDGLRAIA